MRFGVDRLEGPVLHLNLSASAERIERLCPAKGALD